MSAAAEIRFLASRSAGEVSALLDRPEGARRLLVFGHGAGAGMRHAFMEAAVAALNARAIATFRYQFAYMEKRLGRPDPQPVLLATVRAAIESARAAAGDLPLYAGGKSMGGRMTSLAAAEAPLDGVRGLVFFGFPLHYAGSPSVARAAHLPKVGVPMLFLQGTRDKMADLGLLRPIVADLSAATIHEIEDGDHSFAVLKRTGRTADQVIEELAETVERWMEGVER